MQSKLLGSSGAGAIAQSELAIDPMFLAARVALRPLDYTAVGTVLGFYRVAVLATAAPTANVAMFTMRWTDTQSFFVLLRVRVGLTVNIAVTPQTIGPINLFSYRNYTVSENAGSAFANLLGGNNQKMRTSMASSRVAQMAFFNAVGGITGGTKTVDANPIGCATAYPAIAAQGSATAMLEPYAATSIGGHPPVYAANEGWGLHWGAFALASGQIATSIEAEWAEVVVF